MGAVKYYEAVLLDLESPIYESSEKRAVVRHRWSSPNEPRATIRSAPKARSSAARRPGEQGIALPGERLGSVWRTLFSFGLIVLFTWIVLP